ncbi:MAG: GNAT family N-acetyltransferase [Candidatus Limnocylindrales bacterium]
MRREDPADRAAIRGVLKAAFPTSAEADLVEAIRVSGGYVPGYALVAELAGAVVGHILLSTVTLVTGGGLVPVPELAPMAVQPAHQRQGIGSALVIAALDAAEASDEPLVLVLGHPWFYPRFGFRPASRFGIRAPRPVPDAVFMVKPLTTYRRELSGPVVLPPAFDGV